MSEPNGPTLGAQPKSPSWFELLKLVPQIGWLILAAFLIYWFSGPLIQSLDQRNIAKLGLGIVQIEFAQEKIQTAASAKNQHIPPALKDRIERTSRLNFETAILWVDDRPSNNLIERRALISLGVIVDTAKSTSEALDMVARGNYDLVISDLHREDSESGYCFGGEDAYRPANAGCHLMRELKKRYEDRGSKMPPMIFYGAFVDPEWGTPVYAFGATTRVDELFHLIIDALERRTTARKP